MSKSNHETKRRVCPWRHVYTFDNILRRLFHNTATIFGPYVKAGMTVMDVGCGAGFTSIGLARIVGRKGRVISVDLQQEMLDILRKRAERAGLADLIQLRRCEADSLGISDTVDFVNAFWMVHEVPDTREFLRQVHACLKPSGKFLVAEPKLHVSSDEFQKMVVTARDVGYGVWDKPRIAFSRAVVFLRA
ncbi:MAG: SAM-dependent methyltransferase [Planctomycetota bacterium]|nr:MAG: SAM-dependent methyltransferase [Planctomycetota bacterium]